MGTEVVQIQWSEHRPPTKGVSHYDHIVAATPFGCLKIIWKSWKPYSSYYLDEHPFGDLELSENCLDELKRNIQKEFEKRVLDCLIVKTDK